MDYIPPSMQRTLFDKIWDEHIVVNGNQIEKDSNGLGQSLIYIDRHLVHEVTSPQAFESLHQRGRKVRRPDSTIATVDHNVPTKIDHFLWSTRHQRFKLKL